MVHVDRERQLLGKLPRCCATATVLHVNFNHLILFAMNCIAREAMMSKRSTSISFLLIVFLLGGAIAYWGETIMAYYFLFEARWNPGRSLITSIESQDASQPQTGESAPGRKGRFGRRGEAIWIVR